MDWSKWRGILFILICIWTIILVVCNAEYCKKTVHFDELFSYGSANTPYKFDAMVGDREWKNSKDMFNDYLSVDLEDRFNYQMVWENQSKDVHPPLYYAVIHTISSLMPGIFTMWVAVGINLFFMILTLPAIYLLSKQLFANDKLALVICFCFITSSLTISVTMFMRMYVMLLCITTWLTYFHIKWLDAKRRKWLLAIFFTTLVGSLTHYYFLIFLFFLAIGNCFILFINKNYKDIIFYCVSMGIAGVLFVLSYPASLRHMFHEYRGEEAFSNIKTFENYSGTLLNYLSQLGSEMFRVRWGFVAVIAVIVVAKVVLYIMGRQGVFFGDVEARKERKYFVLMVFTVIGHFLVVTKISTLQQIRYLSPIFPLIYLLLIGSSYLMLHNMRNSNILFLIFLIGSLCLFNWKSWRNDNIPEETKIAKEYAGYNCLVMGGKADWTQGYHALNNYYQLIEFEQIYFISLPYENDFLDEEMLKESELIVYLDDEDDIEDDKELLLNTIPNMSKLDFLYNASGAKAYLLH